jgi:hypothetical protein
MPYQPEAQARNFADPRLRFGLVWHLLTFAYKFKGEDHGLSDRRRARTGDPGGPAAAVLAASPLLSGQQHLDISRNQLTDAGIGQLQRVVRSLDASFQHSADAIEERRYLYDGDYE